MPRSSSSRTVYVTRDYYGNLEHQLSVFTDDILELVDDSDQYWWLVKDPRTEQTGYIPSEIIKKADYSSNNPPPSRTPSTARRLPSLVDPGDAAPWRKSGFAHRKKQLLSAPALSNAEMHHKKTVSFSENKPIEHLVPTIPDSPPSKLKLETPAKKSNSPSEGPLASPHSYYDHIEPDPLVEQLMKREFGQPNCTSPSANSHTKIPADRIADLATACRPRISTNTTATTNTNTNTNTSTIIEKSTSSPPSSTRIPDPLVIVNRTQVIESPSPVKPLPEPNIAWASTENPYSDPLASSFTAAKVVYPNPLLKSSLTIHNKTDGTVSKPSKFLRKLWKAASPHSIDASYDSEPQNSTKSKKFAFWRRNRSQPTLNNNNNDRLNATSTPNSSSKNKSSKSRSKLKGKSCSPTHMVRIHAGNFTDVNGYKSMELDEQTTIGEIARLASERYGVQDDGFDYVLSVIHCESHEILPIADNYPLATVIELAKRATLLEGNYGPLTTDSMARLPRSIRRRHKRTSSKFIASSAAASCIGSPISQATHKNASFSCLASPVTQHLQNMIIEEDLSRDRTSDFVTHYKLVVNRWLEEEGDGKKAIPFYLRAMVLDGGPMVGRLFRDRSLPTPQGHNPTKQQETTASGSVMERIIGMFQGSTSTITPPDVSKNTKSALPQGSIVEYQQLGDGKKVKVAKILGNTSMNVNDIFQAALSIFNLPPTYPGLVYHLFLATKPDSVRDRIHLTKDMTVMEVLQLKPMVDPSALTLLIQPVLTQRGPIHL